MADGLTPALLRIATLCSDSRVDGVPHSRVFLQAMLHQVVKCWRERLPRVLPTHFQRGWRIPQNEQQDFHGRHAVVWCLAMRQLNRGHSKGPHVRAPVVPVHLKGACKQTEAFISLISCHKKGITNLLHDFRGHPAWCAYKRLSTLRAVVHFYVQCSRNTKISELHCTDPIDEDV